MSLLRVTETSVFPKVRHDMKVATTAVCEWDDGVVQRIPTATVLGAVETVVHVPKTVSVTRGIPQGNSANNAEVRVWHTSPLHQGFRVC